MRSKIEESKAFYMFKWIKDSGSCQFGYHSYDLPKLVDGVWIPGAVSTLKGNGPETCHRGFHATTFKNIHNYAEGYYGQGLYLVKCWGKYDINEDKTAWENMQVIRKIDVNFKEFKRVFGKHGSIVRLRAKLLTENSWLNDIKYVHIVKRESILDWPYRIQINHPLDSSIASVYSLSLGGKNDLRYNAKLSYIGTCPKR